MKTEILNGHNNEAITLCAEKIRSGGIVAFPTETVYGLGANGLDKNAVKLIFEAKGRPNDNPLILHIADIKDAERLWESVPDNAKKLMDKFFPGPLTIIYKRSKIVPDEVTAGLDTVALRTPSDDIARNLIRAAGVPIAAPSANTSGKPSPTTAQHVYHDLNGKLEYILDGGECLVGVESTVISVVDRPIILRPGGITKEMLEAVIGEVDVSSAVLNPLSKGQKAESPGMKHKHYSPDCDVIVAEGSETEQTKIIVSEYEKMTGIGKKCVIFATKQTERFYEGKNYDIIGDRENPDTLCRTLFALLREKSEEVDVIFTEALTTDGMGMAYMNRLLRAAGFRTIKNTEEN